MSWTAAVRLPPPPSVSKMCAFIISGIDACYATCICARCEFIEQRLRLELCRCRPRDVKVCDHATIALCLVGFTETVLFRDLHCTELIS